jgi:hypothetical protein
MTPDQQAYSLTIAIYPVEVGVGRETEEEEENLDD